MKKKAVVFDYGSGNIHSAQKAFKKAGFDVEITNNYKKCVEADLFIIPGVGAFDKVLEAFILNKGELILKEREGLGKRSFGICVGFQILFERGNETKNGETLLGLGYFKGEVKKLKFITSPNINWESVEQLTVKDENESQSLGVFYFVHSYGVELKETEKNSEFEDKRVYYTECQGVKFVSAVFSRTVSGTQFHPEKSGIDGINLLKSLL